MNELQSDSNNSSNVDTAASAACVRSGAFALLLSVTLLLLIPYWRAQPKYTALAEYLGQRANLASAIEDLDDDPLWQRYMASNEAAESISIAQLLDLEVDISGLAGTPPKARSPASSKPYQKAGRVGPKPVPPGLTATPTGPKPAPPTLLTATPVAGVDEALRISQALTKLNDSDILTRTRQVSNFFDLSVVRWLHKRNGLAYRNAIAGVCPPQKQWEVPRKGEEQPQFVPALTEEALLRCLTVHDVRQLADFERPQVSNPIELGGQVRPLIEISPGSLPRGSVELYPATLAVHVLLFLVVVYFGAFTREAVASPAFPAPGTMFGAFYKSRWTLLVFFLALLTPVGTSVAVVIAARKWTLAVCLLFICWAVFSIYFVLKRQSYFRFVLHSFSSRADVQAQTATTDAQSPP